MEEQKKKELTIQEKRELPEKAFSLLAKIIKEDEMPEDVSQCLLTRKKQNQLTFVMEGREGAKYLVTMLCLSSEPENHWNCKSCTFLKKKRSK